ncbi:amino acid permease [Halobaculum sp. EA56]|uniref:amino acid permease n=1 Tax=Halobaculum sp. EA56 TaxID=3421648 RepID=UPI003EBFB358
MVETTRTLGFRVAFALGLGTMIAAGIFSLSGTAVYRIGSSAVIAFVIAAVVAGITAASYSEFASIYAENGGGYLFASRTFEGRDLVTYGIGASLFLGYTGTTAFYLATMDEWFFLFVLPEFVTGVLPHGSVGIAAAVALGVLNARGTEESGTFQVVVTAAKVAVLFVFIGGALNFAGPADAVATFTGNFGSVAGQATEILSVAALAFITFFGFSAIAASAGEIVEPTETVPKAIAASIVTVTVLYTLVILAMVNTPETIAGQPRAEILQQGETAMGKVAAAFLGPVGQYLIVAGAVFSMVSASNASILAASGIGSLMGRQGHAPRAVSRIHPEYDTPYYSVLTATATISALVFVFITLLGHHGALAAGGAVPTLGLEPLTGFATFNLLVPLSVVNVALIYSRRNHPGIDRGFRVPLVPYLPVLGVVANLALVSKLPPVGVAIGLGLTAAVVLAYVEWGGRPAEEELVAEAAGERQVVSRRTVEGAPLGDGDGVTPLGESDAGDAADPDDERFTVLVPIHDVGTVASRVRLAARIGSLYDDRPRVKVHTTVAVPDQGDPAAFVDRARDRVAGIEERLAGLADELDADLLVEGHVSKDVAFDVLRVAREDGADRLLLGVPEGNPGVTDRVQYGAPCDVLFVRDVAGNETIPRLTIGAGGGPHHTAMLDLADRLADAGSQIEVVHVTPEGDSGVDEALGETLAAFDDEDRLVVREVSGPDIATELVDHADESDSVLVVGATRTRLLRRWVFGSTTDRVLDRAAGRDVPVVVYTDADAGGLSGRLDEVLFVPYRYLRKFFR